MAKHVQVEEMAEVIWQAGSAVNKYWLVPHSEVEARHLQNSYQADSKENIFIGSQEARS